MEFDMYWQHSRLMKDRVTVRKFAINNLYAADTCQIPSKLLNTTWTSALVKVYIESTHSQDNDFFSQSFIYVKVLIKGT